MRTRALFLALLVGGCAGFPPGEDSVDPVISEAVAAARAPAGEQKLALARAQHAFVQSATPVNRLRLATLLAALPAPLRDDARAAELLTPLADAASPGIGRFAALLAAQVVERLRLQREIERLAREAERLRGESERAARERERLDRERAHADKERDKREEAMKQQLEALRAIERQILEREERLRKRQR